MAVSNVKKATSLLKSKANFVMNKKEKEKEDFQLSMTKHFPVIYKATFTIMSKAKLLQLLIKKCFTVNKAALLQFIITRAKRLPLVKQRFHKQLDTSSCCFQNEPFWLD